MRIMCHFVVFHATRHEPTRGRVLRHDCHNVPAAFNFLVSFCGGASVISGAALGVGAPSLGGWLMSSAFCSVGSFSCFGRLVVDALHAVVVLCQVQGMLMSKFLGPNLLHFHFSSALP